MRFTARNLELVRIALKQTVSLYPADGDRAEFEEMRKLLLAVEDKFVDAPVSTSRVEIEATATAE